MQCCVVLKYFNYTILYHDWHTVEREMIAVVMFLLSTFKWKYNSNYLFYIAIHKKKIQITKVFQHKHEHIENSKFYQSNIFYSTVVVNSKIVTDHVKSSHLFTYLD